LVESCGFAKEKDLLAFLIDGDYRLPEWMDSLAGRIAQKKGIRIRPFRPKDEDAEFGLIKEIYNDSWSANWGFDRDRGSGCPPAPPTPPCVRVRTRRFGGFS
jgi:hypothetical protein